ncbi:hypothetical protein FML26_28225 [Klebsiella michiganensis]|nr:hypothetical protein [Klebsiella grimontii]MBZ7680898.1 hypothetical protein [Klebsiella michiganensis]TXU88158.1 hypothetical protein D4M90_28010 [Klebsiella oxytoca]TYE41090.1 hypothetical protein DJ508_29110 [Klebsiella michiganensis]TYF83362.1 hypothetical protein DJ542_28480 [Klebsiella grimontii]
MFSESDLTHSDLLRGHYQYVGRSLKVNGSFCRDTYNESGWDNYETARQLRRQAEQLSLGFVEECWRNHPEVIQAVEKFEYPVFIDEEMTLFNADQDAGID